MIPRHLRSRHSRALTAALAAAAGLSAGCLADNPEYDPPGEPCGSSEKYYSEKVTLAATAKVDVLMVVESGPGMAEVQQALALAMPGFVDRLNADASLDWHLGVVTTDKEADGGRLVSGRPGITGCAATLPKVLQRNTPGAGAAAACLVQVGSAGSALPQPFDAVRLALQATSNVGAGGANAGFARDDARLVVVFVGLHDDCSFGAGFDSSDANNCVWAADQLFGVAETENLLGRTLRPYSGDPVSVVAISGPADGVAVAPGAAPPVACDAIAPARAGNRFAALVNSPELSRRSLMASICTRSFGPILAEAFDVAIAPQPDSACLAYPATGGVKAVYPLSEQGVADTTALEPGEGWFDSGADALCGTSRVSLDDALHASARAGFEVRFCAPPQQAGP
jgi:hypothetical protein